MDSIDYHSRRSLRLSQCSAGSATGQRTNGTFTALAAIATAHSRFTGTTRKRKSSTQTTADINHKPRLVMADDETNHQATTHPAQRNLPASSGLAGVSQRKPTGPTTTLRRGGLPPLRVEVGSRLSDRSLKLVFFHTIVSCKVLPNTRPLNWISVLVFVHRGADETRRCGRETQTKLVKKKYEEVPYYY